MRMKRKGFTLVEIMAASAIMAMVILGILTVTSNVLRTYNTAQGQLKGYFDGSVVCNIIAEDLESIVLRRDGRAWLEVKYPSDVGVLTGTTAEGSAPLRPPEIMFYSATSLRPLYTKENTSFGSGENEMKTMIPGSVCAIKYQLALKNPFMKSTSVVDDTKQINATYGLYRAVIDSRSTLMENMGNDKQGYTPDPDVDSYENSLSNNVWSGVSSLIDEIGETKSLNLDLWSRSPENMLAANVVDFRITFAVMYENKSAENSNASKYKVGYIPPGTKFTIGPRILADRAYEYTATGERMDIDTGSTEFRCGFLSFADISIKFLSDTGATEMMALTRNGKSLKEKDYKRIISEHGTTVVRRVKFMTEPLD